MEFTIKKLAELLDIKHNNISKALKNTHYQLKEVENSTKKVKHYLYEDLPDRYKVKLEEKGIKPKEGKGTNILNAKFTQKYLLASKAKQEKAVAKCKFIEFYLKRDGSLNQEKWIEKTISESLDFDCLGSVSPKQLNDWLAKYKDAKESGENLVETFIDSRGATKGVRALTQDQKDMAERFFIKKNRPTISKIYRKMKLSFGDTLPSRDVLYSYYNEWKKKNPVLSEFAISPDSAKNKYLVAFGDMSAKAKHRNHYWELDSTPADILCSDGKRYTVLAAIDVFTRRVVFHVAEKSSAYTISQLLRKAILKLGIPQNVVIDNGKDYRSSHFESICSNLEIDIHIVPPFSGDCKPHVERVFRTLSEDLFADIPGYIGNSVAMREEIQASMSFEDKIRSKEKWREEQKLKTDEEKEAFKDAWKIKQENIDLPINLLITPEELQSWCDRWTDVIYEQDTHGSINTKPILKWKNDPTTVEGIPDIRMLDLLLGESTLRKMGKKGIRHDGCRYIHDDLVEYMGHHVFVMSPPDLGELLVYSEDMNFICIAVDTEYLGQDRAMVKNARKKQEKLFKALGKIVKEAKAMKDPTIMDEIENRVGDMIDSTTYVTTKRTSMVETLLKSSKQIEEQDEKELENSSRYDFKKKDEDGKPTKVLPNGRPKFNSLVDRFVWALEHDQWNDKDEKLKEANSEIYELAYELYSSKKIG